VKPRTKTAKQRLDVLLVERGMAESRQRAQALVLAGHVLVGGQKHAKAGTAVPADARIEILGQAIPYVSRGGVKLEGALAHFGIDAAGKICIDVGSSTGGFTDCLLQRGAGRVYAVDVNVDQLAWKLQQDKRVVRVERNARNLRREDIAEPADLVTIDLSFISVRKVLSAVVPLTREGADFLILVKPQFELQAKDVGKGGIVRDSSLHRKAVDDVSAAAQAAGLRVIGSAPSRLPGAEGNLEFFLHARREALG
jgi:23S rRNA (cytidine1920-2'-O)/16S rRNA (cytidine1409-2'-O)-methyltransferase